MSGTAACHMVAAPALLLLGLTLLATFMIGALGFGSTALSNSGEVLQPEVLEHRVAEVLRTAGYNPEFNGGDLQRLEYDHEYLGHLAEGDDPSQALKTSEYGAIVLRYRGYPILRSTQSTRRAHEESLEGPLETEVLVDGHGHLRRLTRIPSKDLDEEESGSTGGDAEAEDKNAAEQGASGDADVEPVRSYAWAALLGEAGLDPVALAPVAPTMRPPVYADSLVAWDGALGDVPVRVHAASLKGRPVWFHVDRVVDEDDAHPDLDYIAIVALVVAIVVVILIIATLRNAVNVLRRKEGDFAGARKIAYAAFGLQVLHWVLNAEGSELLDVGPWLLLAGGTALAAWLGYLILEPHARARWPHSLVSWTRLLQGRWRDPMVGRDLLVATALGVAIAFVMPFALALLDDNPLLADYDLNALLGVRRSAGVVITDARDSVTAALALYIVLLGLQNLVRSRIAALVVFILIVPGLIAAVDRVSVAIGIAIMLGGLALVMIRYGLLALVVLNVIHAIALHFPITLDARAWWAPTGFLGAVLVIAPAIAGYILATAPTRKALTTARNTRGSRHVDGRA